MRNVSQMTTEELLGELNAIGAFGSPRAVEIENELRGRHGVSSAAADVMQS